MTRRHDITALQTLAAHVAGETLGDAATTQQTEGIQERTPHGDRWDI